MGRAKALVFTQFLRCCKIYFLYTKTIKTLYFTTFLLPMRSQKSSRNSSKTVQNRFPEASYNFGLVFPDSRSSFAAREPKKCENTSRVKDFSRRTSRRGPGCWPWGGNMHTHARNAKQLFGQSAQQAGFTRNTRHQQDGRARGRDGTARSRQEHHRRIGHWGAQGPGKRLKEGNG